MADLKTLISNYFEPKESFGLESLFQMIQETRLTNQTLLEDEGVDPGEEKTFNIAFPKIRITEDFGKIGTEDRQIIEKFAKNITGSTLEEKIASLNSVLTEKKEDASIGEILSTMVMCEILSAIITNFTEAAGGFIFEGFLAGLFGGQSIQIQSAEDIPETPGEAESGVTGKPITDVMLNNKHYSLKLLGENTDVKGSFRNMVEHFRKYDHVIYLDARRVDKDQGLQFGEFLVTLSNFLDIFVVPFLKDVTIKEPVQVETGADFKRLLSSLIEKKQAIKRITTAIPMPQFGLKTVFEYSPTALTKLSETKVNKQDLNYVIGVIFDTPSDELDNYAPFKIKYAETKFEGTKANALFGSYANIERLQEAIEEGNREEIFAALELTPGYVNEQQFVLTKKQVEEKIKNFKNIGTLMIGKEYMENTFAMYADLLRETITPVYEQLQFFTNNINDYFLGVGDENPEQDKKQYALDAINNANQLATVTTNAVEKIEK
jgi:hypothetical protein